MLILHKQELTRLSRSETNVHFYYAFVGTLALVLHFPFVRSGAR